MSRDRATDDKDTFALSTKDDTNGLGTSASAAVLYSADSSYWSVWKTAEKLQENLSCTTSTFAQRYAATTQDVIQVLHVWGEQFAGKEHMSSFLRKSSRLLHETEECIVALHHFKVWWMEAQQQQEQQQHQEQSFVDATAKTTTTTTTTLQSLTVVDACCGKGYFSMFLSYMIGFVWNKHNNNSDMSIKTIVLLDKTPRKEINWSHVETANQTAAAEGRPRLELWDATNLHKYDELLDRLQGLDTKLAFSGIHLCKMLSPSLIGF